MPYAKAYCPRRKLRAEIESVAGGIESCLGSNFTGYYSYKNIKFYSIYIDQKFFKKVLDLSNLYCLLNKSVWCSNKEFGSGSYEYGSTLKYKAANLSTMSLII